MVVADFLLAVKQTKVILFVLTFIITNGTLIVIMKVSEQVLVLHLPMLIIIHLKSSGMQVTCYLWWIQLQLVLSQLIFQMRI